MSHSPVGRLEDIYVRGAKALKGHPHVFARLVSRAMLDGESLDVVRRALQSVVGPQAGADVNALARTTALAVVEASTIAGDEARSLAVEAATQILHGALLSAYNQTEIAGTAAYGRIPLDRLNITTAETRLTLALAESVRLRESAVARPYPRFSPEQSTVVRRRLCDLVIEIGDAYRDIDPDRARATTYNRDLIGLQADFARMVRSRRVDRTVAAAYVDALREGRADRNIDLLGFRTTVDRLLRPRVAEPVDHLARIVGQQRRSLGMTAAEARSFSSEGLSESPIGMADLRSG